MASLCRDCLKTVSNRFGQFLNDSYLCFNSSHPPLQELKILIEDLEDCSLLPEGGEEGIGSLATGWLGKGSNRAKLNIMVLGFITVLATMLCVGAVLFVYYKCRRAPRTLELVPFARVEMSTFESIL
jgi:hypothetical protein